MFCFHDRLKQHTFIDGVQIKCCVDCTIFDNRRAEVLRVSNIEVPQAKEQTHWQFLLEEAGLSDKVSWCDGNHLVEHGGSLQDIAKLPIGVLPTLKKLYDQRRIDGAKRYTP